MEVFNIFSPDKIQFWQYTYILYLKIADIVPYDQRMEFCIFTTFYYLDMGIFASIDGIMFHTKNRLAMTVPLVLSGFKRRERQYNISPLMF